MKKLVPLILLFVAGCSYQNPSLKSDEYSLPSNISSDTKLSMNSLELKPYNTKGIVSEIKSWFSYYLVKHHRMVIDQVILTDTNQRIDDTGTQAIKPDYSGKDINISIKGTFDKDVINSDNILYKNEANLLQISYVGELLPRTKIMIDDSILLEPVSATKTEIKLKLKTQAIPDLYLKGLHKLSILSDRDRTDTLIRIGDPEIPNSSLVPSIDEVKMIKVKDIYYDLNSLGFAFKTQGLIEDVLELAKYKSDTPIYLKLKGKNLMMFYKFSYSTVDSKFVFGRSTAISKDAQGNTIWEAIINVPDPKNFTKISSHSLSYSTPFGTVIKKF